jgi:phosphoribosyl 1,2-cyclic phosphodiesterase
MINRMVGQRMGLQFTVLASGSGGNATLIESGEFGLLIDAGLGPRQLASRFAAVGRSWAAVKAVILTHTHADHWKDRTLAHLKARHIPLYCHRQHASTLQAYAPAYAGLCKAGLVRFFEEGAEVSLTSGLRCQPFPVRHDGGPTFGFRVEGAGDLFGQAAALAYAADLGCWDESVLGWLKNVDLLAVEFNHDVHLERTSGRSPLLIARVLGDEGHLSNAQAASLLGAVLEHSTPGRLRHLVQLHLSRDCNRPVLAQEAAQAILREAAHAVSLHTAEQDQAGMTLHVREPLDRPKKSMKPEQPRRPRRTTRSVQPFLPGFLFDQE